VVVEQCSGFRRVLRASARLAELCHASGKKGAKPSTFRYIVAADLWLKVGGH
jgi:hypothetical protein